MFEVPTDAALVDFNILLTSPPSSQQPDRRTDESGIHQDAGHYRLSQE